MALPSWSAVALALALALPRAAGADAFNECMRPCLVRQVACAGAAGMTGVEGCNGQFAACSGRCAALKAAAVGVDAAVGAAPGAVGALAGSGASSMLKYAGPAASLLLLLPKVFGGSSKPSRRELAQQAQEQAKRARAEAEKERFARLAGALKTGAEAEAEDARSTYLPAEKRLDEPAFRDGADAEPTQRQRDALEKCRADYLACDEGDTRACKAALDCVLGVAVELSAATELPDERCSVDVLDFNQTADDGARGVRTCVKSMNDPVPPEIEFKPLKP